MTLPPALAPLPSPARSNPFARPAPAAASASFSRASLLPSLASPAKAAGAVALSTPGPSKRHGWRLLWRGGLEIGAEGWRLDGITFFALLDFASTPLASAPTANPFDAAGAGAGAGSPAFPSETDTDLCLSLESMRGRKWLAVRGVIDLDEGALEDDGGVHLPHAPLLAAYFTHHLCRHPTLAAHGRTTKAVLIGLGDEGLDSASNSLLVFGQRTSDATLKLCVGRRRPPAAEPKVKPGEPLPRDLNSASSSPALTAAPLFFPSRAPTKPPPPIPRRHLAPSRSFSRNPSTSSIYAPPQPAPLSAAPPLPPAPVSGRTPGRRGEKRPRKAGDDERDEQRRRRDRVVLARRDSAESAAGADGGETKLGGASGAVDAGDLGLRRPRAKDGDEDIFGKRPIEDKEPASAGRAKRARVPQQVLDNKAVVRKQTAVLLEQRGVGRGHDAFKDVFGMTTKGVYFAYRDRIEHGPLDRDGVRDLIGRHLDMYLLAADLAGDGDEHDDEAGGAEDGKEEVGLPGSEDALDALDEVKEEREDTEELLELVKEEREGTAEPHGYVKEEAEGMAASAGAAAASAGAAAAAAGDGAPGMTV